MNTIGIPKLTGSSKILLVTTSVAAVVLTAIWMWKKRRNYEVVTGEFKTVGKIAKLIIYPVKSLPGIEVESAECTKLGLKVGPFRDRQWLIVKKNGNFIHQRIAPTLALTSLSFHGEELWINGPGMNTLKLAVKKTLQKTDTVVQCRVWGGNIKGIDCGEEAAEWFNKYLKQEDLRLVQYVEKFEPRSYRRAMVYLFANAGALTYQDDGCIHVFTEESIQDLNSRLKEKITYRNFRPSILVTGADGPYAEDNWKFLKAGTSTLMFVNPCGRCVLTTVNPDTGEKTEKDPLVTLKTYRMATIENDKKKLGQAPLFGIYMGSYETGFVSKGDQVSAVTCPRVK